MQPNHFTLGKIILFVSTKGIILQKTKASKIALFFGDFLSFATIGVLIFFIVKANQPLHWPPTFQAQLLLAAVFIGIAYFLFRTVRSTVNECKGYTIAQKGSEILINGKLFAAQSRSESIIKKKVGYEGFGVAYEIQLKHKQKRGF